MIDCSSASALHTAHGGLPVLNPTLGFGVPDGTPVVETVGQALTDLRPDVPVYVWRPHVLEAHAREIVELFPGICHYAVKSNPAEYALKGLWGAGVRAFDVASLGEVKLVAEHCPGARMAFMHPVKSPRAITEAYFDYGVKAMVLDHPDELAKIVTHTNHTTDITLIVRLAVSNSHASLPLSGKFGAMSDVAAQLLRDIDRLGYAAGVSFHVGSQCLNPIAYKVALEQAHAVMRASGVPLKVIDVGGGFPVPLQGQEPPAFGAYADMVRTTLNALDHFDGAEVWAEPGRALVARAGGLAARVELRRSETVLHLNDGAYGGMFEGGPSMGLCYRTRVWRDGHVVEGVKTSEFSLFGPTCDSVDKLPGPFVLPADIQAGDWIEFAQLGAYGEATRTPFNGFGQSQMVVAQDGTF